MEGVDLGVKVEHFSQHKRNKFNMLDIIWEKYIYIFVWENISKTGKITKINK